MPGPIDYDALYKPPGTVTAGPVEMPSALGMADRLRPFIKGPWIEAVCGSVEDVLDDAFGPLAVYWAAALDTRDPVWREGRPEWHLTMIEREAQVSPLVGASLADRYRAARMADVTRWSQGLWSDILRLAAAWCNVETADPAVIRVYAWPLVVVYLFHPSIVPMGDNLDIFRREVLGTIQDVAGYAMVDGYPGLVLSFDNAEQGFDNGLFGDTFDQLP
jgi:hypothetical protein